MVGSSNGVFALSFGAWQNGVVGRSQQVGLRQGIVEFWIGSPESNMWVYEGHDVGGNVELACFELDHPVVRMVLAILFERLWFACRAAGPSSMVMLCFFFYVLTTNGDLCRQLSLEPQCESYLFVRSLYSTR